MTASKPLSDFDQEIVDLVRQHWDDTHLPFLLSQLGNRKDGKIAKEVKEKADGLAAYLRQELADHIDVVRHSIIITNWRNSGRRKHSRLQCRRVV